MPARGRIVLLCAVLCASACSAPIADVPNTPIATSTLILPTVTPTIAPPTVTATVSNLPAPDEVRTQPPPVTADAPADDLIVRDPIAAELVRLAREQVARTNNLPLARIRLVEVRAVTWTDSALNCPLPDAVTLPLTLDGYRIVLRAGERDYLFHADIDRVTLCDPANIRPLDGDSTPEATVEQT
ncbi:MAG: hypothetical protein SGJ24_01640 [Chloroflexota bacterium]|nr:hypothetical protein [Chloroflexota bacterium]